jgi:(Z)-2-((N-methylformamido)methylene)-5-hydroxybutyrolactone dehydrogenase
MTSDLQTRRKEYQLFIGGRWVNGSGETIESTNPYTGEVWAEVRSASATDVDAAVNAAAGASEEWRRTSGVERARLMFRLAEVMEREARRLAEIETTDNGKIIRETENQIRFAARNYRFFAGLADKIGGATQALDSYTMLNYTTREPHGVTALITAWNSPLSLLANKLPPALAAGNTAVIKPSEYTPASTLELARLIEEVGFPPGVVNVVVGAAETGRALTSHPRIDMISFTGSVETGRAIAQAAATSIIPVALELGGKSANIVFDDADRARATAGAVAGIFAAAGQTCVAGSRLLLHRSLAGEILDGVAEKARSIKLGDPLDPATEMGPLANQAQLDKVMAEIDGAKRAGARLVTGGGLLANERGLFVTPTVFTDVRNDMDVARNEIFGPVLGVQTFEDDTEAVRIANDTRFGLAAGIWTKSLSRAHLVAKELRAGMVWVNTYRSTAVQAPFGGVGDSGYARERGVDAIHGYTRVKNTMIDLSDDVRDPFLLKT